jgi:hypothetical protein
MNCDAHGGGARASVFFPADVGGGQPEGGEGAQEERREEGGVPAQQA